MIWRRFAFFFVVAGTIPFGATGKKAMAFASTSSSSRSPSTFSWVDRFQQLVEYQELHGDTMVPKRYSENPSLGNWVNKQRVLYRKYCAMETPCSLTAERIEILNQIGFVWDGKDIVANRSSMAKRESTWWTRLQELHDHYSSNNSLEGLSSSLGHWMRQQRQEYKFFQNGDKNCKLDKEKVEALNEIHPEWWKTSHQLRWERRCLELKEYKNTFGDCCVPITYQKNKKLANWVSNCRKNYNLMQAGERSSLTKERIKELDEIGFVWNRWDYEFDRRDTISSKRKSDSTT